MDTEKLINSVRAYPVLYNVRLFGYHDQQQKNLAWDCVAEVVGCSAEECRKRWKGLRDHYRKEKRREKERRRSGSAGGVGRVWRYGSVMEFLDPFLEERPSTSNLDEAPVEDEGETQEYAFLT
ncbi:uncharacterized protein V6R79_001648 [Siganus canaliculatus]